MDKSCSERKDCIAHHYWHHMDNRKKRFFKPMLGDFRNGVTIPKKFSCDVGRQISEVVKLETPDGNTHIVQVAWEMNNLVLRSGWARFASVYELEEGDFLVFKYCGDSRFKVEIYDPTTCEKELSCVAMNRIPSVKKQSIPFVDDQMRSPEDERFVKHCRGSGGHSVKTSQMKPATSTPQQPTEKDVPSSEDIQDAMNSDQMWSLEHRRFAKHCNGSCSHSWKTTEMKPATPPPHQTTEKDVPSSEDIQDAMNSDDLRTSTRTFYVLATGCNLTKEHGAEVDKLAQKICPDIPLYVKTLDRTNLVDESLVICKDYAIKYLPRKDKIITLCHASTSKTWSAYLKINAIDDTYILDAGWLGFVHDNELREGDSCVFEVSKIKRSFTLIVHLLKASYQHPAGFIPSAKSLRPKDNVRVTQFTTLEGLRKTKVHKRVEAIGSEIPIFVSVMQKSSVACKRTLLSFSQDYARDYLPDKCQTVRLHRPGESTPWKVSFRTSIKKCWLDRGWKRFTDENKLKLGDICLFELMKNKKNLSMMVHVIKKEEYC